MVMVNLQLFQNGEKVEGYYRVCIPLARRYGDDGYASLYGIKSVRISIDSWWIKCCMSSVHQRRQYFPDWMWVGFEKHFSSNINIMKITVYCIKKNRFIWASCYGIFLDKLIKMALSRNGMTISVHELKRTFCWIERIANFFSIKILKTFLSVPNYEVY